MAEEKTLDQQALHEECCCDHDHDHEQGESCCCEHDHDHEDACGCGHDHDHSHHHHDHCGCGCDHDHDEAPETRELSAVPTFSYHVLDIDCPHCAMGVQNAVRALPSVADARLVYATSTLDVVMAEGASSYECRRAILETVRSSGQDLELSDEEREELSAQRSWYQENRERVLMSLSGAMLVAGLVTEHLMGSEARAIPF